MTRIRQIDAFTSVPFRGNPAGVCMLDSPAEPDWMQNVAAEMNVAETAFLWPQDDGFRLRWFTPTTEVDLCGHATLASAHALWESGILTPGAEAVFHTNSGRLTAEPDRDLILLDFPSEPAEGPVDESEISDVLGVPVQRAFQNRFDILAELESAQQVRSLRPDIAGIAALECRGLIVTAPSDDDRYDFLSRFFAPRVGVNEDPVTGSAHCFLCPYWGEILGKNAMTAYQASRRGGEVRVELHGDRVRLGGRAVTVLDATLLG